MNIVVASAVITSALVLEGPEYIPVLIAAVGAAVEPTTVARLILPINVAELIKAIFFGIATLCVPVATVYIMIAAARAKKAEEAGLKAVTIAESTAKQIDGLLKDRDAAKVEEGKVSGAAAAAVTAEVLKEGQRQGAETERASVAAANPHQSGNISVPVTGSVPVPVTDAAALRVAEATETLAAVAEKTAAKNE